MKSGTRTLMTALVIVGLALALPLGMNRAIASETAPLGSSAVNPFFLHDPVTGATASFMPTTAWLKNHGMGIKQGGTGSTSSPLPATGSTTTPSGGLPAPACTLATDSSVGDAPVILKSSPVQNNALDLTGFGLSTDTAKGTLTAAISVNSLTDGPGGTPNVVGSADYWDVLWNFGNDPTIKGYFLQVKYPGTPAGNGYVNDPSTTTGLPVEFIWGTMTVGTGGVPTQNFGGAATGTFDTANNRVTITAPLSSLGLIGKDGKTPLTGAALTGAFAQTNAEAGAFYFTSDTLNTASSDYAVGQAAPSCPGPKTVSGPTGIAPSKGTANNMSHYGGPVVHTIKNHLIWWLPQAGTTTYSDGTTACTIPGTVSYSYEQPASGTATVGALPGGPDGDTDYQSIIRQYFTDLTGTAFYNLLTQYSDNGTGITQNAQTLAGEWTDHCGYTSTPVNGVGPTAGGGVGAPPVPGGTQAFPITQQDIKAEVARAIQINKWPTGPNNEYFVYTGYGVADCFSFPAQTNNPASPCGVSGPNPYYCAYHGDYMDPSGSTVLYADMLDAAFAANPAGVSLCYTSPIGVTDPSHTVNGKAVTDPIADAEVNITSHEQFETVNDALVGSANDLGGAGAPPLAWVNANTGEIGDICAYNYGNFDPKDGSNITLHGHHYIVQQEQSNWNNGCALTPYQNNGGYGGSGDTMAIQQGWNVIGIPTSGITNAAKLVADMTRTGQLPARSITKVELYRGGKYITYVPVQSSPKKGAAQQKPAVGPTINRTDGVLVYSTTSGTYTPSGTLYTSSPTINLTPGWNLVAATYPNPGLSTDTILNQIQAQTRACTSAILTNESCSATISEIKVTGAAGDNPASDTGNPPVIDWKPAAPDANGHGTWPQNTGDHIPFTSGMWIYSTKAITWTVQGSQCQTVDAQGICH